MNEGRVRDKTIRHMWAAAVIVLLAVTGLAAGVELPEAAAQVPDRALTLEECTLIALQSNPDLTFSEQAIVSARAGLTRARSSYYPHLSLDLAEGITSKSSFLSLGGGTFEFGGTNRREDLDLTARHTVWRRGRKESVEGTKYSLWESEFSLTAATQGLVDQVAADYYGLLAAGQLVGVAEGGMESAQSHLEQVEARIEVGASAEVDVYPALDDLARAELDLIDARSNVRLSLARLKNTMGVPPHTKLQLAPATTAEEEAIPRLEEAIGAALETRSEVMASAASVGASRSALRLAKIRRGPMAEIAALYAQGYTDWEARTPSWNVLLIISWALFDGYATKADQIAAGAGLASAEAGRQRMVNLVALEVESTLVEVERSWQRVAASQKSVAAADARMRAAEGKYQQGVGIFIEVIDARTALTQAQASEVRARYDYRTALVALDRALGTLQVPAIGED